MNKKVKKKEIMVGGAIAHPQPPYALEISRCYSTLIFSRDYSLYIYIGTSKNLKAFESVSLNLDFLSLVKKLNECCKFIEPCSSGRYLSWHDNQDPPHLYQVCICLVH